MAVSGDRYFLLTVSQRVRIDVTPWVAVNSKYNDAVCRVANIGYGADFRVAPFPLLLTPPFLSFLLFWFSFPPLFRFSSYDFLSPSTASSTQRPILSLSIVLLTCDRNRCKLWCLRIWCQCFSLAYLVSHHAATLCQHEAFPFSLG